MPAYRTPLCPSQTACWQPGHFWAIPLSKGAYAAGRVLAVNPDDRSTFITGLMDWSGPAPPTSEDLAGRKTIEQGQAHDLTIVDTEPTVTGFRALELDGLCPDLRLSQAGWPNPWLRASSSGPLHMRNGSLSLFSRVGAARSSKRLPKRCSSGESRLSGTGSMTSPAS